MTQKKHIFLEKRNRFQKIEKYFDDNNKYINMEKNGI